MKNTKGLTLIETIISMAVLVVITLMVFSVCNYVVIQTKKNEMISFFENECENYTTCYLSGEDKYASAIEFYTDQTTTFGEELTIYYSSDYKQSSSENYAYTINLSFDSGKFIIKCYKTNSTDAVYSVEV